MSTHENPYPRPAPPPAPPPPRPGEDGPAIRQFGASLLELLIAVSLFAVLTGALLTWVWSFQQSGGYLNRALERDENLRLAPLLLARYLSAAGNGAWEHSWEGLRVSRSGLQAEADLEGRDGFPDGSLDSRFERIRLQQRSDDLRLSSGRGSYQPILTKISDWSASRPQETLLRLRVTALASPVAGASADNIAVLEFELYLPNFRLQLFRRETP